MDGEVTQRKGAFDSKPNPILEGVQFQTIVKPNHHGGTVTTVEDGLELSGVKEIELRIVSNSSFYHKDFKSENSKQLTAIEKYSFKELKDRHIRDHQSLFDRVDFDIITDNTAQKIPTDERIEAAKGGAVDLELQETLFHYGRYLLIASSRPGTLPANLQGLWNQHINAPWNADYHLNINLQMNYWLANLTQLDELNGPLFNFTDKLIESGKTTAQKNFGMRGSFLPHATDLWAPTWLRAPTAYWGASFGAGGWMVQHYWQHYQFTQDLSFLEKRAYPALEAVAEFYSDWLIRDKRDGSLIAAPSTSPENRYLNEQGKPVSSCLGSAMDQQVITEVFTNFLKAAKLLNRVNPLTEKIKNQLKQIRTGFQLGAMGEF
jgi:alpha-L-fucosidase 2